MRMWQGSALTLSAGTMTVAPAGVPHRLLGGTDVSVWGAGFCASCLGLDEGQPLLAPFRWARQGALPIVSIPKARRRRVVSRFRDLEDEAAQSGPESRELTRCLLLLLLGEFAKARRLPTGESAGGSLVADALRFIQQHALSSISLKDVAASVCRTPSHVASSVKEVTGYTVGEWIASARVAEAASRLAHTDDSLDAIASHVGWGDKTHFIRQFKKAYGVTPAAWRRGQRAHHPGRPPRRRSSRAGAG